MGRPLATSIKGRDVQEIAAYMRQRPEASKAEVAERFQIPYDTLSHHWKRLKSMNAPDTVNLTAGPRPVVANGSADPVVGLNADDRQVAIRTVRKTYRALEIMAGRILESIETYEGAGVPLIDRDTTTALLNLQRMAHGMIDAHPGLMQLAGDDETDGKAPMSVQELDGHLAAILASAGEQVN